MNNHHSLFLIAAIAALMLTSCGQNQVDDPAKHGMDPEKLAQIDQAVEESLAGPFVLRLPELQ